MPTLKHTSTQMHSNGVHTKFAIKNHTVIENATQKDSFFSTDRPKDVWHWVPIAMVFTTQYSLSPVISSLKFIYSPKHTVLKTLSPLLYNVHF
jgi:hypothetical protein